MMTSSIPVAGLPQAAARARLDWSVEVGPSPSKPVVSGTEVYVGTQTVDRRSELHCFDAKTGRRLSKAHTWPGVLETELGGTAIMRSPDGQVMGVNARSGERNWGFQPSSFPSAIVSNGETVAVASDRMLTGLVEPQEAPLDLSFQLDLKDTKNLAPGPFGGWLAHTGRYTGEGRLNSLDAQGNLLWSVPVATGGPQHTPASTPSGEVLSANFEGYVSAHRPEDGAEVWRFSTAETYINPPDVGPEGQVIVSTANGSVSRLNEKGKAVWTEDTGDRVGRAFVHSDGTVFVQHPTCLEALDATTGKSLQKLPIHQGDLTQGPDGNLYNVGKKGVLQRIVLEDDPRPIV